MPETKWLTVAAIAVLIAATGLNMYWVWGLLFIYWAIAGIREGSAFIIEPIERAKNPYLFWIINGMWAGLGLWGVIADLSTRLA